MSVYTDSQKVKIRTKLKPQWLIKGGEMAAMSAEVPQALFSQSFSTPRHLADTRGLMKGSWVCTLLADQGL